MCVGLLVIPRIVASRGSSWEAGHEALILLPGRREAVQRVPRLTKPGSVLQMLSCGIACALPGVHEGQESAVSHSVRISELL
jgi:hypothetical protein